MEHKGGRVTLSDLLYLCALAAVIVGVAILVAVFLGAVAAVGAALLVTAFALYMCARSFAAEDSS
jgi:hypothetical protein